MGLINGTVELKKDYVHWQEMFNQEKELLKNIFNDLAISIEHVGSTAVEGLLAKPIVDIAVGVHNLSDVEVLFDILKDNYTIKVKKDINEILLIKEKNLETSFLIHVLEIDSERYQNMIIFRDILINNLKIKKEYESLKIDLKNKYSNDREMYTKSKHDFIEMVIEKRKV